MSYFNEPFPNMTLLQNLQEYQLNKYLPTPSAMSKVSPTLPDRGLRRIHSQTLYAVFL